MIELETVYRSGIRTFFYLLLTGGWWLLAIGAGLVYLSYAMYLGSLNAWTVAYLSSHADWYVTVDMISLWILLTGVSFVFVGYIRASVLYRKHSYYVDDHAFHLRRGLFRVEDITIPYTQISNVHIEQPYHWRLLGLAQLDITISSSRDPFKHTKRRREFLIPVIDKRHAKSLAHFLIKRAAGEDDDLYEEDDDVEDELEELEEESGLIAGGEY
jgi:membrane protein YdbS with pleckstrin-like domain